MNPNANPPRSGPNHPCPACGVIHRCLTEMCRNCREDAGIAYLGGWYVKGGIQYPLYPERRSA